MKRKWVLMLIMCFCSVAVAVPDIQFTPGGSPAGGWSYDGNYTFSFDQQVLIDHVLGSQTDFLFSQFVHLPDLTLENYTSGPSAGMGSGTIQGGGVVEIKDGDGTTLLSGTLSSGTFVAVYSTAPAYPEVLADLRVDYIDNVIGSDYLDTISVGDYFDFNLTIQSSTDIDNMIVNNLTGSNGFSGSMTLIPEPVTVTFLGIGGLVLLRRKT